MKHLIVLLRCEEYPPVPDPHPIVSLELSSQRSYMAVKEWHLLLLEVLQGPLDPLPRFLVELEVLLLGRGFDLNTPVRQAISL